MSVDSKPDEAVSIETWREAAAGRDLLVGAAVAIEPLVEDERYRALLATQCSVLVAENAMKPTYLQPEPGVFDFRGPEPLFAFAKEHEQKVRGHTLVWHQQMPQWMKDPPMMLDMQAVLRAHVHGVTDYYRGKVFAWDVVNEAFEGDGSYRNSPWFGWLGEAYLSDSFTWARQHDPEAELFYNDYGIEEINPKSDAVYQWCRRALDRGVPIDGIGFQMHITSGGVNIESMARNFERFARLGLKLHITEMDVRLKLGEDGGVTAQQLEEQARYHPRAAERGDAAAGGGGGAFLGDLRRQILGAGPLQGPRSRPAVRPRLPAQADARGGAGSD